MPMNRDGLDVRTIETPSLGDRSYVAIHEGWAIAVDVQRDIGRVEAILGEHKARLGAVLETHVHNDYLSGGLALARRHRAQYVVPAGPRLGYSAIRPADGTAIHVGAMTVRTIDTPGHTDAHATYALEMAGASAELAFTGGSLLIGTTGRTDLLGWEHAEALARRQYWSVRRLARLLGAQARILPTHGFGSFCAAGDCDPSGITLAEQLEVNPAFHSSEDDFVADLLSRLGDYPAYYAFMGPRNAGGVWTADFPEVPVYGPETLEDLDAGTAMIIDVRSRDRWARAHIPGSLSIDARGPVATWTGWLMPIDTEVTLIVESEQQATGVLLDLHRIGVDEIKAIHVAPSLAEVGSSSATAATFLDLAAQRVVGDDPIVFDVRETSEWRSGHIAGALHAPAHRIGALFEATETAEEIWLHCGVGLRATIAASILLRMGIAVVIVDDDLAQAPSVGLDWCDGANCPDRLCTSELTISTVAERITS